MAPHSTAPFTDRRTVNAVTAISNDGRGPSPLPSVFDANDENFERDVVDRSTERPVIVDLWAAWCGPCRVLGPILERIVAEQGGRVLLAKVDVDANPATAQAFRVQSIPAVYVLRDGKVLDGFVGSQPEHVVRQFVEAVLRGG